nr:N-6 DNA methylase [uncultured Cohaesibacter sp.]
MKTQEILSQLRLARNVSEGLFALLEITSNLAGPNKPLEKLACVNSVRKEIAQVFEGVGRALLGTSQRERYQILSELFDATFDGRASFEVWIRPEASRKVADMIGDAASVRFSYPASIRPCLDYAMESVEVGRTPLMSFVTPDRDQAFFMEQIIKILSIDEMITVVTGWGWGRCEVSDAAVEVMFPPFGMPVTDEDTIPERTLASLGLEHGKIGRLLSETLAIADATEMTRGRVILSTTTGAMFRMVGSEAVVRENLIRSDRLQAIMGVPSGMMYTNTGIPTLLVILSTSGAQRNTVCFVDLGHERVASKGRRGRFEIVPDASWADLASWAKVTDRALARDVSIEEIRDNNLVLTPNRYLSTGARERIDALLAKHDVAALEDLVEFIRPVSISEEEGGEFTLLEAMPSDIGPDGFIGEPKRVVRVSAAKYNKARNQRLSPGDVIIAVKGTVGAVALVPEGIPEENAEAIWTAGQSMMILRATRRGGIDALALYEYLSDATVQEHIQSLAGGAVIQSIGMKDLKALPIPLPDPETLKEVRLGFQRQKDILAQIEELRRQLEDDRSACWPHRELRSTN